MKRDRQPSVATDAEARRRFLEHTWVYMPGPPAGAPSLVNLERVGPIHDIRQFKSWLPVVGDGNIVMAASQIPGAGRGLFAGRAIVPGELVTFYDGPVARFRPLATIPKRQRSHLRVLLPQRYFIVGDARSARLGEPGTGGGALINHSTRPNVEFVSIDSASNEWLAMNGDIDRLDPFQRIVAMRALQGISAGTEFLADYGGPYWAREAVNDDDDEEEVEFDLGMAPEPVAAVEPAPKRRRIAPTPITMNIEPMAYPHRRCDVCLVHAVTHLWPALGLYCCQECWEA